MKLNLLVLTQEEKEALLHCLDSRILIGKVYSNLIDRFTNTSLAESTVLYEELSDHAAGDLDYLLEEEMNNLLKHTQHKLLKEKILTSVFLEVLNNSSDFSLKSAKHKLIKELEKLPLNLQELKVVVEKPSFINCNVKYFYKKESLVIDSYINTVVRQFCNKYNDKFITDNGDSVEIQNMSLQFSDCKNLEVDLTVKENKTYDVKDRI